MLGTFCSFEVNQIAWFPGFGKMIKAKEYFWQDSNLALFGSSQERQVKSESVMSYHIAITNSLFADLLLSFKMLFCYLLFCQFPTEESAVAEPAWKGTGQKVGIKIWRIVVC